jgi:hypothetical protein
MKLKPCGHAVADAITAVAKRAMGPAVSGAGGAAAASIHDGQRVHAALTAWEGENRSQRAA